MPRVRQLVSEKVWRQRYHTINQFEQMLLSNIKVIKFISKDEQNGLESRLQDPDKRWKFSSNDLKEPAVGRLQKPLED